MTISYKEIRTDRLPAQTLDQEVDLVIEKDLPNPVLIESIQQSRQLIYE